MIRCAETRLISGQREFAFAFATKEKRWVTSMENSERSALGYASKASQNIHLVTPHGIDSIKVDLQTTDEVEGYDCSEALRDHQVRVVSSDLSYSQTITPVRIRWRESPIWEISITFLSNRNRGDNTTSVMFCWWQISTIFSPISAVMLSMDGMIFNVDISLFIQLPLALTICTLQWYQRIMKL